MVTEALRRWLTTSVDRWLSSSCDGPGVCPGPVKRLPRDLINDAAVVEDRFSEVTEGMLIVCDLFGTEDDAEVIWCELSISVKSLDADVGSFGGGSSGCVSQYNGRKAEHSSPTGSFE